MADANLAYDLSRFEAQTAERRAAEQGAQIKKVKQSKAAAARVSPLKAFVCLLLVIGVTSGLLYTRVQLTERTTALSKATAAYTELQAEGTRMSLELEGKVSLKNAGDYAETQLGMVQLDSNRVEHIRLVQENRIEVPDSATPSVWDSIVNFFQSLLA